MIVLTFTVVCSDEAIANDVAAQMPDFSAILDRPGVSRIELTWTADRAWEPEP